MFSELIKLRELSRLLRKRRYLEVLSLARDPGIRDHRKAVVAAEKARRALLEEAEQQKDRGEITRAFQSVRAVLQDQEEPPARRLEEELRTALGDREAREAALDGEVRRAVALAGDGDSDAALARLEPLAGEHRGARNAVKTIRQRCEALTDVVRKTRAALGAKDLGAARGACEELRGLDPSSDETRELHTELLKQATKGEDTDRLGAILGETRQIPEDEGPYLAARRKAASQHLLRIEKALKAGDFTVAARWIDIWPLRIEGDELARSWARGLRVLDRARRVDGEGDRLLAKQLGEEAKGLLPASGELKSFLDDVARREKDAKGPLEEARAALASGRLLAARAALVGLLENQPRHREAIDLLDTVAAQDNEDRTALNAARGHLDIGGADRLAEARRLLTGLSARRPDLEEVAVLLRDTERRARECRMQALDQESRLLSSAPNGQATSSTIRGPLEDRRSPGHRPIIFRNAKELPGTGTLSAGLPFVLRVEEQGDWYAHPANEVLIGNASKGVADLPILAAIGTRHVRILRRGKGAAASYVLAPVPGRKTLRNRRPVKSETPLRHGDVIGLGGALEVTFLRPVPANGTAVLELSGDFTVRDCRRVLLFSETGRDGGVVIGPGPQAHVAVSADRERVELLRGTGGDSEGLLLARSPRGVAVGEGSDRPQVRVRPGDSIRAGRTGFFVDPA